MDPSNTRLAKVYFPNLNGLRFFAAFLVIIHHVEQFKYSFGLSNYFASPFIAIIGKLGVILFFVLSGFLITYLLLTEQEKTNTISIKKFYIRRILRIWPLYYLIVILSFFVLPKISFFEFPGHSSVLFNNWRVLLLLFLFFLPNVALGMRFVVPYASQAWSVGVEEQFYLIWPVLMKYFKNTVRLLLVVIIIYLFMELVGFRVIKKFLFWNSGFDVLRSFWHSFNIDCMAIGGLFAYILHKKDKILLFFYNRVIQFFTLLLLIALIGYGVVIPYVHYEFYAVFFGIVILNLASNPKPILNLENGYFNYLGKISYGLYMFHPLAIVIILKCLNYFGTNNFFLQLILSTILTIIISSISYHFMEEKFIKMKTKFSKIISGDNAK